MLWHFGQMVPDTSLRIGQPSFGFTRTNFLMKTFLEFLPQQESVRGCGTRHVPGSLHLGASLVRREQEPLRAGVWPEAPSRPLLRNVPTVTAVGALDEGSTFRALVGQSHPVRGSRVSHPLLPKRGGVQGENWGDEGACGISSGKPSGHGDRI